MRRKHPSVDYGKNGSAGNLTYQTQLPFNPISKLCLFQKLCHCDFFGLTKHTKSGVITWLNGWQVQPAHVPLALHSLCTSVSSSNCSGRFWFGFTFASSDGSMDPIFGKSLGSSKWPFLGCFKWLPFWWSKGRKDWRRVERTGWTTPIIGKWKTMRNCTTSAHQDLQFEII